MLLAVGPRHMRGTKSEYRVLIESQPLCSMKYVQMSTTSVMGRDAPHLEDIDLMAFSRFGLRILAAEDMTISADFITAHYLCFCAHVRPSLSALRPPEYFHGDKAQTSSRVRASRIGRLFSRFNQRPQFSTAPASCPSCSPPASREREKRSRKSIAIYCKPVALHLHLGPLLNHAIMVWMSSVDNCLTLGLEWRRSHL